MDAMSRGQENRALNEVTGLLLLGLGTLLFLSLISYTPKDLPAWFPLSYISPANKPAHNFIGTIGAMLAGTSLFFVGAAAYLVTAVLFGYGGAKLLNDRIRLIPKLPWIVAFIVSGACIIQVMHLTLLHDWNKTMHVQPGGCIGQSLGVVVLQTLLGFIGSKILLACVYLTSLILMTGIQPILLLRKLIALPGIWREQYRQRRIARANERELLEMEEKKLAKEAQKIERKLKKQGIQPVQMPESEEDELPSPDELEARPEPQIIDTAAPQPKTKPNKAKLDKLTPNEPAHFDDYKMPELDLLDEIDHANRQAADPEELRAIQATLIETLEQFGINVAPGDITKGPTITRYEVYPAKGVRVDKITSLERDLARATRAERINILAPIPGKDTVGIEIANLRKTKVTLRELLESEDWQNSKARIPLALGKDVYGRVIIADLAQMPHCLVAGTTGSGKSVCINSMIASMLYKFGPEELQLIMIDPKVVEMQIYSTLPHLRYPVVTDPKKVLLALRGVIDEMEKRYKIFAKTGVRNITSFNARPKPKSQKELDEEAAAKEAEKPEPDENAPESGSVDEYLEQIEKIRVPREDDIIIPESMSYIVIIVDELADLMQTAPADVENGIARITQMARAAGIHMIVATQTPRADVVTGVIKANIPSRIAFQVASKIDSRVILDENGAERLLGQGDMLYLPPGTSRMVRSQGVLVTDEEIHRLVDFASAQGAPSFDAEMHERLQSDYTSDEDEVSEEDEELVQKCIEIMRQEKKCSTSMLQRRLRLGYTRAARVVDILEQRGYVAPGEGAKPREILKDLDALID